MSYQQFNYREYRFLVKSNDELNQAVRRLQEMNVLLTQEVFQLRELLKQKTKD